jgi:hypothetical protein
MDPINYTSTFPRLVWSPRGPAACGATLGDHDWLSHVILDGTGFYVSSRKYPSLIRNFDYKSIRILFFNFLIYHRFYLSLVTIPHLLLLLLLLLFYYYYYYYYYYFDKITIPNLIMFYQLA